MKQTTYKWLALAIALGMSTAAMSQVGGLSNSALAIHMVTAVQGRTETTTSKTDGGTRITERTTEYDAEGRVVKKTTKVTDYTEREGRADRKVKKVTETTEEYDSKGKKTKTTTKETEPTKEGGSKVKVVEDKAGATPKRIVSEEELDSNGKPIKKTDYHDKPGNAKKSETDYKDGKPTKKTEWDDKGRKTKETEYDEDGKPKKETTYDEKGNKNAEFEDFDKEGKPRKVTTYDDKGRKKTEGVVDENGNLKSKKEYDDKGRLVKETHADGTVDTYEYDGNGKIKKKIVRKPDGSGVDIPYKDGKPGEPTHIKKGKAFYTGNVQGDPIIYAPTSAVAGKPFAMTITTLEGQVVANEPVVIDGGVNGTIITSTDLHGNVIAEAPKHWNDIKVLVGGALAAIAIDRFSSGGPAKIGKLPPFLQPGTSVQIPGSNLSGAIEGSKVTVGGKLCPVLASSPNGLTVAVPPDLPVGENELTVEQNGSKLGSGTVEAVQLQWERLSTSLVIGQKSTQMLTIIGTSKPVDVTVIDNPGDGVKLLNAGTLISSGGSMNQIEVQIVATAPGKFTIPALLNNGMTDYEKDLERAELARKEAAGWRDSAAADSSEAMRELKNRAASNYEKAAKNWDDAAEARKKGQTEKAELLEKAASEREEAGKNFGDSEWSKGTNAERSASALEGQASRK